MARPQSRRAAVLPARRQLRRPRAVPHPRASPLALPDWAAVMLARRPEAMLCLRNVQDFAAEADFFGPGLMQAAAEWLDRNPPAPQFCLPVASFDVPEPFHIPEPYRSLYASDDY